MMHHLRNGVASHQFPENVLSMCVYIYNYNKTMVFDMVIIIVHLYYITVMVKLLLQQRCEFLALVTTAESDILYSKTFLVTALK